ncbi:MAG: hypothetical protein E7443_02695 [Ruminococcaceae bacterium]|nr:hypothetical protein [Oscillospiraceae bacterium]
MALTDILRERLSRKGNRAQVACGALGVLTVEALPPAELTALLRGAGGARAVLYAACRELQAAGEDLRKAGSLFQPDEIMAFLSEDETQSAVRTILELSGMDQSLPERTAQAEEASLPAGADEDAAGGDLTVPAPLPALSRGLLAASEAPAVSNEAPAAPEAPAVFREALAVPEASPAVDPTRAAPKNVASGNLSILRQPAAVSSIEIPQLAAPGFAHSAPAEWPTVHPVIPPAAQLSAASDDQFVGEAAAPPAEIALKDAADVRTSYPTREAIDEDALAERVARRILAGLRNAAAVR